MRAPDIRLPVMQLLDVADTPPGEIPDGVALTGAPLAWPENRGEDAIVAVLDTGVDMDHPDLLPNLLPGYNATNDHGGDRANTDDNHGHGTHVAGIIAANGRIKGVAPGAKILPVKVLWGEGYGFFDDVAWGLEWLTEQRKAGRNIVEANLSLGAPSGSDRLHNAIKAATAAGIQCNCAAGNAGDGDASTDEIGYPAMYPESTSTAAVDILLRVAKFSNSNREVDIAGPGLSIYSTWPGGGYARLSGTSMATPHVTGLAALLARRFYLRLGRWPTEPELYAALKLSTVDIAEAGVDASTGAGFGTLWPAMPRYVEQRYTIDSQERWINDRTEQMDVAPHIQDSRTFLPARHVVEPLGARVGWDAAARRVTIIWRGLSV